MRFIQLGALCIMGVVNAWNSEGHLLIARMAYDILKKDNPIALNKANDLLSKYSDFLTQEHEKDYPFVECVTLADDNKRRGGGWQSNWHFDDTPFTAKDSDPSKMKYQYNEKNITMAMPAIYKWLKGEDVSDTIAYQTIMKLNATHGSEDEAKSLALRLIIHYMGDIHQPLHCSDRYSEEFPEGDLGGNKFTLKNHYAANELHAVWDNVIYNYHKNPKRPFTQDTWLTFGGLANDLIKQFTFSKTETDTVDFKSFAKESYDIAVHVYDGLTEGKDQVVPQDYIDKYGPIAKRRVALAAKRLVYLIGDIFGDKHEVAKLGAEQFLQ